MISEKKWPSKREVAERIGLDDSLIKFWCEEELIPARKKKVEGRKEKNWEWEINPNFLNEVELVHERVGGIENLFGIDSAANIIGVEKLTLNAYLNRGIPVEHIKKGTIKEAIGDVESFRVKKPKLNYVIYHTGSCSNGVLKIPYIQYVEKGNRYIPEDVVLALGWLNRLKIKGWIPVQDYAQIVGKPYKYIKHLCYRGRLNAGKGLNSREWLVDPSQISGEEELRKLEEYQKKREQLLEAKIKTKPEYEKIKTLLLHLQTLVAIIRNENTSFFGFATPHKSIYDKLLGLICYDKSAYHFGISPQRATTQPEGGIYAAATHILDTSLINNLETELRRKSYKLVYLKLTNTNGQAYQERNYMKLERKCIKLMCKKI